MKRVPLPETLFRSHPSSADALAPFELSGGWRWDDYRAGDRRRFHVLYTAESVTGALIETLQKYATTDKEALALFALFADDEEDTVPPPAPGVVPASVLRGIAITSIVVLDPTAQAVDPFDLESLREIAAIAIADGIDKIPETLKVGDLGTSGYDVCQRAAAIIHDVTNAAGIVSRSALDNPRDAEIHANYSLFRATPREGSALRVSLRRGSVQLALDEYRVELAAAFAHLRVVPEISLDHPDLGGSTAGDAGDGAKEADEQRTSG